MRSTLGVKSTSACCGDKKKFAPLIHWAGARARRAPALSHLPSSSSDVSGFQSVKPQSRHLFMERAAQVLIRSGVNSNKMDLRCSCRKNRDMAPIPMPASHFFVVTLSCILFFFFCILSSKTSFSGVLRKAEYTCYTLWPASGAPRRTSFEGVRDGE